MAEFSEVMKQWGRLCIQHCTENADDCDGCSLGGTGANLCAAYVRDTAEGADEIERIVMSWAAEHPELVYPAWRDWLRDLYGNPNKTMTDILESPIDPEIARRLDIVPRRSK